MAQTLSRQRQQNFETSERQGRETFERAEEHKRQEFEERQARDAVEAQRRIQMELQSYIKLEEWREESLKRMLSRLEQASQELSRTSSGLESLIDEGPFFDDLRMIRETARVLDVFGDFQSSVGHFSLPPTISEVSERLVAHATKILLTLSPLQAVRQSDERKQMLAPLKADLQALTHLFMRRCSDFERNPATFLGTDSAA